MTPNLWRFRVMHRIDAVNSITNFFFKNQFNSIILFQNWIELNWKGIILSPCRFISIISHFLPIVLLKRYFIVFRVKIVHFRIIIENELNIRSIQCDLFIELSEGDNLGDNDNFSMILFGSITLPKVFLRSVDDKTSVSILLS